MTLQQKMLAKQSKKGFTLVELVVVIAILAILAAIAIPSVIGIISSASKSAGESDASSVNSACKTLYAGIKSGSITTNSTGGDGAKCSYAAAPNASSTAKLSTARAATVDNAQAYSGLKVSYDDLYYYTATSGTNTQGTIVFSDTGSGPAGTSALTGTTTMGTLYPA